MNGGRFLIIGSGERMSSCAKTLADKGFSTDLFSKLPAEVNGYDYIILPLPTLRDGLICGTDITLSEFISLHKDALLFYGNAPKSAMPENAVSYCAEERFMNTNSYLTALGLLRTAKDNHINLYGRSVAVVGYGFCSREICKVLKSITDDITVYARSRSAVQEVKTAGYHTGSFTKLDEQLKRHDVIINTVPARILDSAVLNLNAGNTYIEIASSPFGFDASKADTSGFKYIKAPGLPGKYFPRKSGALIADTVLELIGEGKNE